MVISSALLISWLDLIIIIELAKRRRIITESTGFVALVKLVSVAKTSLSYRTVTEVIGLIIVVFCIHLHDDVLIPQSSQSLLVLQRFLLICPRLRVVLSVLIILVFLVLLIVIALGPRSLVLTSCVIVLGLDYLRPCGLVYGIQIYIVIIISTIGIRNVVKLLWEVTGHEIIHQSKLLSLLVPHSICRSICC